MDATSDSPSPRRAAVAIVSISIAIGLAIGAALWLGSRNLVMGATIGLLLALLFGGFAVFALRVPPKGRVGTFADGGAAMTAGGAHAHDTVDGGSPDGGGGGGGDGG